MASGQARLAEIPSAAYRASPAKRAGSCVFFSCNRFKTGLARQSGLRNLQRMCFMTRLCNYRAKYFTARAGNPHVIAQIISALLGGPARLTVPFNQRLTFEDIVFPQERRTRGLEMKCLLTLQLVALYIKGPII